VDLSYDTALELAQLAGLVLSEPDLDAAMTRVTQVAVAVVHRCDGASLTMRRAGVPDTPAASDEWAKGLDELQFAEQEGPCLDCLREGSVMRSRDLSSDERFPSYGPRAAARGARSALSLPLAADGRTVGALNLYSREPAAFDRDALGVGELLAAHAALGVQAAIAYDSSRDLAAQMRSAMASRAQIEQAKGVLVERETISPEQAFDRLVELSQAHNRKLRDVAADVVEQASGADARTGDAAQR
jgi:GAF domain-containing protein